MLYAVHTPSGYVTSYARQTHADGSDYYVWRTDIGHRAVHWATPEQADAWIRRVWAADPKELAKARWRVEPVPNLIDLDAVVELVRAAGVECYAEQTGGGTATLYAGNLHTVQRHSVAWYPVSGAEGPTAEIRDGKMKVDRGMVSEDRWDACAGPGFFKGPGFTHARADMGDFFIGPDDDGETDLKPAPESWTEREVADAILRQVRGEAT